MKKIITVALLAMTFLSFSQQTNKTKQINSNTKNQCKNIISKKKTEENPTYPLHAKSSPFKTADDESSLVIPGL